MAIAAALGLAVSVLFVYASLLVIAEGSAAGISGARGYLEDAAAYLPASLALYGVVLVMSCGIGVPLGVLLGSARLRVSAWVGMLLLVPLLSAPALWLAHLVIYAGVDRWEIPMIPMGEPASGATHGLFAAAPGWIGFWFVGVPAAVLSLMTGARLALDVAAAVRLRMRGASMALLEARGLPRGWRLHRYAFPASAAAILDSMRRLFPPMVGASLVVEWIFSYPGLGNAAFEAARRGALTEVLALAALMALAAVLWGFALDLAGAACNVDRRAEGDGSLECEAG
ncbi:MAG: ABC transporter permease subunit [Verrucomicrobiales bacterium]